jgi:hypothetical protein
MGLAQERMTTSRQGSALSAPVKAVSQIWQGGIVALLAGKAIAARVAVSRTELLTMAIPGIANASVLGGAADGDKLASIDEGCFQFANSSAGDAITLADRGQPCFVVDDQTVAKTVGAGLRPIAGIIADVDANGVWVRFGASQAPRRAFLTLVADDLRGAQAQVYRTTAPRAGAITKVWSKIHAALATGDAVLTGKIGATAITGGVLTITQAGSAAGDLDTAEPTAANVVAEGDEISFTVSGPNTVQTPARLVIELTY